MEQNNFRCNRLMQLHFKGLNVMPARVLTI